jgi:hypothetical protein
MRLPGPRPWLLLVIRLEHGVPVGEKKNTTTTIGGCLRERSSSVASHYLRLYHI